MTQGTDRARRRYGFALMSEQHPPSKLVDLAVRAEAVGFDFAMLTDHFQPWTASQGHGSFVWAVLGAIAARTSELTIGTGVVCPSFRMSPALTAIATATLCELMPQRFVLGLGTGGALNEHITGARWPRPPVRRAMLEEALDVMERLWNGDLVDHHGSYYTVDSAQLWGLPLGPPPIWIAASGVESAALAGRRGNGLVATAPEARLVDAFRTGCPDGEVIGWLSVCYDDDQVRARELARQHWPIPCLGGDLLQELRLPRQVEAVTRLVRPEDVAARVVVGSDPAAHAEAIGEFLSAGFTGVYVHQIAPDGNEAFFDFWQRELRPLLPD